MATIVNKSEFTVSVNPAGRGSFVIPPRSASKSGQVSDEQAKEWEGRPHNKFVEHGFVLIQYDRNAAPKSRNKPKSPASVDVTVDGGDDASELSGMHWRSAVAAVADISDLDLLEKLHAAENRPRVRTAIEERMAHLSPQRSAE